MKIKFTAAEEREFEKDVAQLIAKLAGDIAAHARGLDNSPEAIAARRRRVLLDQDYAFLCWTYFPHHIRGAASQFQEQFCQRFPRLLQLEKGCSEWWIAPRGECKSTLLTKVGPVFLVILSMLQMEAVRVELGIETAPRFLDYVLVLGAETRLPTKLLEVVKTELTHNAALQMDFPEVCGRGPLWRMGEAIFNGGVKIDAYGADQAIRGTFHGASRPSVLLLDDPITDSEARSQTERQNRWDWVEAAIKYLGPPDGSVKFFGVGTVLNADDVLSRAKKSPEHVVHHFRGLVKAPERRDLWDTCAKMMRQEDVRYKLDVSARGEVPDDASLPSYQFYLKHRAQMDAGAVISWPEVRTLYGLMRQKTLSQKAFMKEIQGQADDESGKIFAKRATWSDMQLDPRWIIFGACDPSLGKRKGDPSALVIGGYDIIASKLYVIISASERRTPSKLLEDLAKFQKLYNPAAWFFESNGAFDYMRQTMMRDAMRIYGVILSLIGIIATVSKEVRINSLEPFITDTEPGIVFHETGCISLLEQADTWPEPQAEHHYDELDGLQLLHAGAVSRAAGYGAGFQAAGPVPKDRGTPHHNDDTDDALWGVGAW